MNPLNRYQARTEELEALKVELETKTRPGDPGPVAARVLEAAGDLLRRASKVPCDRTLIDTTLKLLTQEGLQSFAEGTSVEELKMRVERAADEAVEAALPDSDDDGPTWGLWAMQGLLARDRAESAICALERLSSLGRGDATSIHQRLKAALSKIDGQLKSRAAALTAVNASRRAERELLDPEVRNTAWWFDLRCEAQDDALVKALGGDGTLDGKFAAVSEEVTRPRKRAVGFDELFRFDLGLATDAERATIAAQKKASPDVAKALAAMEEGERAILELSGEQPPMPDNVRPLPRRDAGQGSAQDKTSTSTVVEERTEFRVLLFRRTERVHLVVQPRRPGQLAAAAVYLPDAPEATRPFTPTAAGLDFDLGPEKQLERVTARVVVSLKGGRSTTIAVKL
jgi:hypothetical protein